MDTAKNHLCYVHHLPCILDTCCGLTVLSLWRSVIISNNLYGKSVRAQACGLSEIFFNFRKHLCFPPFDHPVTGSVANQFRPRSHMQEQHVLLTFSSPFLKKLRRPFGPRFALIRIFLLTSLPYHGRYRVCHWSLS